tara:strand:- start:2851 stop:3072 length:222 start_codon:yes stop_codon:yes gene_type:complete
MTTNLGAHNASLELRPTTLNLSVNGKKCFNVIPTEEAAGIDVIYFNQFTLKGIANATNGDEALNRDTGDARYY